MTGDGGEYLRAEDLRELGDDSLPGHYLDSFSYMSHNLDRSHVVTRHLLLAANTHSSRRDAQTHNRSRSLPAGRSTPPSTRETEFSLKI